MFPDILFKEYTEDKKSYCWILLSLDFVPQQIKQ